MILNNKKNSGGGGIRTHASEETGALNQRLRPLGHATTCKLCVHYYMNRTASYWVQLTSSNEKMLSGNTFLHEIDSSTLCSSIN